MNGRNWAKFGVWLVISMVIYIYGINEYVNGNMVQWYYYRAKIDGYAIDDDVLLRASIDQPVTLAIARSEVIDGLVAVPVRQGDRLPKGATGVIPGNDIRDGKGVALEGNKLKITIATQSKEQNGIRYTDSYKHKNIETNPWSGIWNVGMVLSLGFALGMLAQSVTDLLGVKYGKIEHFQRPGASG